MKRTFLVPKPIGKASLPTPTIKQQLRWMLSKAPIDTATGECVRKERLVVAVDVHRPVLWHDYFITVGGAAATLKGLVFVALSLNLGVITNDSTHWHRSFGTLSGFMANFMMCDVAVMGGQNFVEIGIEGAVVASVAAWDYVVGYTRARQYFANSFGLQSNRIAIDIAIYVAEIVGANISRRWLRRQTLLGGDCHSYSVRLHDFLGLAPDRGPFGLLVLESSHD